MSDPNTDQMNTARWMGISIGSLMLAGCFSMALVVARVPIFANIINDPDFFRRALVVHVDLALIVWFYAFIAALMQLVATKAGAWYGAWRGTTPAIVGIVLMVLSAGIKHAEPVLANYVPVVDHPLFITGLVLFGIGVLAAMLSPRLIDDETAGFFLVFPDARIGLRACAIATFAAALTFYGAWLSTPRELENAAYYELIAWGGGHVLQLASETAMLSVWLILIGTILKRPVLSRGKAAFLFGLLVTPHLAMPAFTLAGTSSALYYNGATQLMRWGIFPAVLTMLGFILWELKKTSHVWSWRDPRLVGFATSASLTVTGFILGAMIRGSNTMIPAHYHAAIGAVTVSFMTVALVLIAPQRFGLKATPLFHTDVIKYDTSRTATHTNYETHRTSKDRYSRLFALQPVLFGVGQLVFAIGFAMAGAHGMGRKVYGAEQAVRGVWDWLGLSIMGLGGLVAVAGGLAFIFIFLRESTPLIALKLKSIVGMTYTKEATP